MRDLLSIAKRGAGMSMILAFAAACSGGGNGGGSSPTLSNRFDDRWASTINSTGAGKHFEIGVTWNGNPYARAVHAFQPTIPPADATYMGEWVGVDKANGRRVDGDSAFTFRLRDYGWGRLTARFTASGTTYGAFNDVSVDREGKFFDYDRGGYEIEGMFHGPRGSSLSGEFETPKAVGAF